MEREAFSRATKNRLTFPNQHQGQVRERREIAAGADRSPRWHARMHIIINKRNQRVERLDAEPREALGQHVGAQRHRRAHRADRQRIADACGVAPKKVQLQRFERAERDLDVGERSKSGVDAVGRLVAARAPLDDVA